MVNNTIDTWYCYSKWSKTGRLGTRLVSMYFPWLFVCMHSIALTFVHCCSMFMYLQVSCSNLVVLSLLIVISRDYRQKTDRSTDHFKSQLKGNFPSSWSFCTLSITVVDLPPYSYEWEGTVEEDTECLMVSELSLQSRNNYPLKHLHDADELAKNMQDLLHIVHTAGL